MAFGEDENIFIFPIFPWKEEYFYLFSALSIHDSSRTLLKNPAPFLFWTGGAHGT